MTGGNTAAGESAEYMTGVKTLNSILFRRFFADFRRIRHTTGPEQLLGFVFIHIFTHAEAV
ncbi:hypothetical protein DNK59_19595 [Pseudomonas sp. TKO26]|nr:hypothetical protein DNK62_19595 [Pseudomonas sp. TKO30]PYY87334.1 hypothetical protein DNK59_19595 [Pseudomonas sp. TKO26]PYY98411.1 hypothetical protein DNK60_20445 [Pseudomonas sp. TKO14]